MSLHLLAVTVESATKEFAKSKSATNCKNDSCKSNYS